jgi:hypothetical protein
MAPEKKRGAATTIGKITASWPYPTVNPVRRFV